MFTKFKSFISNPLYLILLAVILFHVIFNILWQYLNTAPPTWDSAGHLALAFTFADRFGYFFKGEMNVLTIIQTSTYYPPLVHFIGGIVFYIFGRNYEYGLISETLYLILAIVYIYKIIRFHIPNRPYLAILSALIFSLFPGVWEQSRNFHLDVPVTALLLVSYYYLIKSSSLKSRLPSFLFFLFFSFVQLTKWYGFVFLAVPFIYQVIIPTIKAKDYFNSSRLINLLIGVITFVVVAIPWYVINYTTLMATVKISSTADAGDPTNVFSYESLFHYLKLITTHQIGIVCVALVLFAIWKVSSNKEKYSSYLLQLVLLPYLLFSFIQNKDLRYVLPLTPVFAFYISYVILAGKSQVFKSIKLVLITAYLLFYYFFFSFNPYKQLPKNLSIVSYAYAGPQNDVWVYEPSFYSYNFHDYKIGDIEKRIEAIASKEGLNKDHYKVLEASDNRYYAIADFDMFKLQYRFFNQDLIVPFFKFNAFTPEELDNYLRAMDFAIIPDSAGPPGLRNILVLNQIIAYFKNVDQNRSFALIDSYVMPDGNTLHLYKRITQYFKYDNIEVKPENVSIQVSNILRLDKQKYKGSDFQIYLYSDQNATQLKSTIIVSAGGTNELRIQMEGVNSFKTTLYREYQNIEYLYGWKYRDGYFYKDISYVQNPLSYKDFSVMPVNSSNTYPEVRVEYVSNTQVKITLIDIKNPVFVAYSTKGWNWKNQFLNDKNRELTLPLKDLIQFNVSSKNIFISNVPSSWGVFPCYAGDAACFYGNF